MARISDLLAVGRTFSFEFFPPRTEDERRQLVRTLRELEPLAPSFVSITYRGGRASRGPTTELVTAILRTTNLTPMAHLICVAHTRLELAEILVELRKAGVENLMALGGDPPTDPDSIKGQLEHAIELVELAHAVGGFSVGVAAHPIGHPRSPDMASDRAFLAEKLERADFAITQFFFEASEYLHLIDDLHRLGVTKPVIPGIMPVASLRSIPRMAAMGAPVPAHMVERFESAGPDPADVRRVGVEMFTELCQALLAEGVPGLHFYTLNQSTVTREIYAGLGLAARD
ncbi:MAG TPA: methylenetetrahydrofolate reductase [Acidimicrobiales bacterium]|nr:methylenetetrahydrofolate reductase [Acidimicrobiales bacterium]